MDPDFKALIRDVFDECIDISSMCPKPITEPDTHLDAACIAYLEARGYVCLRKHTEAPTEDLNGMFVVFRSIYSDRPDKAVSLRRGHQLSRDFQDFRSFGCEVYALGPLPEGK